MSERHSKKSVYHLRYIIVLHFNLSLLNSWVITQTREFKGKWSKYPNYESELEKTLKIPRYLLQNRGMIRCPRIISITLL